MKKALIILIMTSIISQIAIAQNENEERELETAVESLRIAMVEANKSALENAAAEELSYGHSGGHVENRSEFVEKIVSGESDFVSIDLSNQTLRLVGETAIVRHDLSAATKDGGKDGSVKLHVLSVWQKQNGKWKMLARQAVKMNIK